MRPATRWASGVVVSIGLFVSIGCGGAKVYPVQGRITFEGKPLAGGGVIVFVPLGEQAGKGAGGEIMADGTYQLTTNKPSDGSMAGKFRVLIVQSVDQEPEPTPDGQTASKPIAVVAPADRIPGVYANPQQSPLTATVEAKDLNEINFDLKHIATEPQPSHRGAKGNVPLRDRVALLKF